MNKNDYFQLSILLMTLGGLLITSATILSSISQNAQGKMLDYDLELNKTDVNKIYNNVSLITTERDQLKGIWTDYSNYSLCTILFGLILICLAIYCFGVGYYHKGLFRFLKEKWK